jgi:hypothetical protein
MTTLVETCSDNLLIDFVEHSVARETVKTNRLNLKKLNSVVLVRMRTIPTERPQPVGEVSANFS